MKLTTALEPMNVVEHLLISVPVPVALPVAVPLLSMNFCAFACSRSYTISAPGTCTLVAVVKLWTNLGLGVAEKSNKDR